MTGVQTCALPILFPVSRKRDGIDSVEWLLPNYQHLLRIMKNPTYAGAFAWGRTTTRSRVIDGRARKTLGHRIGMDQWQVLLKDHHEGYTSWDQYMDNVRRLASNRTKSHQSSSGAPRNGSALLAGLLRCARCGHKLHVGYRHGSRKAARYYCMTGNKEQGKPSCLSFGGVRVENAIVECVLDACQPLGIEASLQALEGGREEQNQKRKALEFALEKARFEAERARRQYDAADPENRLVAAELEARWNAALAQVAEIEIRLKEELQSKPSMSEQQRERLLTLGADLRALWDESSTTMELKKRVLRSVVNEVMVDVNHDTCHIDQQLDCVEHVAAKNGGEVDLIEHLARPIPLAVICELLGLPAEDRPKFKKWFSSFANIKTILGLVKVVPGLRRTLKYLRGQFEIVRQHPNQGLITALVEAEQAGDRLSDDELQSMVMLLLLAGHETTVHLLSNSILTLLQLPAVKQPLLDDWSKIDLVVEEMLRYNSPAQFSKPRFVTADTELHGQALRRGEVVLPVLSAANYDPAQFENPAEFRIDRPNNHHLGFGAGPHVCLALKLARAETEVTLERLFTRWPHLQPAFDLSNADWSRRIGMRSLNTLVVKCE